MDEVVELVVVIPMSPRSSKMESGCKNYHRFCVVDSSRPDYPPKFGRIICLLEFLVVCSQYMGQIFAHS
jgi:hypothetical protein